MDAALLLKKTDTPRALTADAVRRFYERYLFLDTGSREHVLVVFYDAPLPEAFWEGLKAVRGTRVLPVDASRLDSQARFLASLYAPEKRYLSVHDYCQHTFFPPVATAVKYLEHKASADYTSFEFPRFDVTPEQAETLILRYVSDDPAEHMRRSDAFFARLGEDPGYRIEVRSGPARDRVLEVRGPAPWMEIAGPLKEGDVRFAPGAELFHSGTAVNGVLHCNAGINLLPLRGTRVDEKLCRELLALGERLPGEPLDVVVHQGRVVDVLPSRGSTLAAGFQAVFSTDVAFSHVIEVGVGLSDGAGPIINGWGATSNEAIPGVHLGIGADPGAVSRFKTQVHMDFVVPDVDIDINGRRYLTAGRFSVP